MLLTKLKIKVWKYCNYILSPIQTYTKKDEGT